MASDYERRRRHNEAKARAHAILNDAGVEVRRGRSRKAKAKARRLLATLDERDKMLRRDLELAVARGEKETEKLETLMARLLRVDATRRSEMINEIVKDNVSRWPTLQTWRGLVVGGTWQGKKVR